MRKLLILAMLPIAVACNRNTNENNKQMQNETKPQDVLGRKNFGGQHPVIAPLPCIMIATYDANKTPDVMMAAWGGQCDHNKITFELSKHKTTDNIRLNKAFTISFAGKDNVAQSDYFGIESGNKVADKVSRVGFTVTESPNVAAPIVNEYPLTLECKAVVIEDNADGGARIVGEVVNWSAAPSVLNADGKVDFGKLNLIIYDSSTHAYRVVGDSVGQAWQSGKIYQ